MRLRLAVAFAGLLLAGTTSGWLALADHSDVAGTAHDLGTPGAVSSCETCHIPHEASGEVIWEGEPRPRETLAGLAPGCYSCHDGTVASGSYAFDKRFQQHVVKPGEVREDCDSCHDPHNADYDNFLLFPSAANLCQACHEHATGGDHPLNIDARAAGYPPRDETWAPGKGDHSGTRLWDASGQPGDGYIKCLTCHAAHGTDTPSLLTMELKPGGGISSVLCQNCHPR